MVSGSASDDDQRGGLLPQGWPASGNYDQGTLNGRDQDHRGRRLCVHLVCGDTRGEIKLGWVLRSCEVVGGDLT